MMDKWAAHRHILPVSCFMVGLKRKAGVSAIWELLSRFIGTSARWQSWAWWFWSPARRFTSVPIVFFASTSSLCPSPSSPSSPSSPLLSLPFLSRPFVSFSSFEKASVCSGVIVYCAAGERGKRGINRMEIRHERGGRFVCEHEETWQVTSGNIRGWEWDREEESKKRKEDSGLGTEGRKEGRKEK